MSFMSTIKRKVGAIKKDIKEYQEKAPERDAARHEAMIRKQRALKDEIALMKLQKQKQALNRSPSGPQYNPGLGMMGSMTGGGSVDPMSFNPFETKQMPAPTPKKRKKKKAKKKKQKVKIVYI